MKKSKDITKYNLKWQIVRSQIKGSSVLLDQKLKKVNDYFDSEKTIDAYERVLNYLEGLQLGYKGKVPDAVDLIQKEIDKYRQMNTDDLLKEPDGFITFKDASKYDFDTRYTLWKDLFLRNKKWLQNGYHQKEINDFMDVLNNLFQQNGEKLDAAYSWKKLQELRKEASTKENKHKFFF